MRTFVERLGLSLLVLFAGCGTSDPEVEVTRGFIYSPGEYVIVPDALSVRTASEPDGLFFDFRTPTGTSRSFSPSVSLTDPWFLYVESEERVWIHDGKDELALYEVTEDLEAHYTLESSSWILDQVPPEVADQLPAEMGFGPKEN